MAGTRGRGASFRSMDPAAPRRLRIAVHRVGDGYLAHAPELPGCWSHGASEVEAVENARARIRGYMRIAPVLAATKPTVEVEISA